MKSQKLPNFSFTTPIILQNLPESLDWVAQQLALYPGKMLTLSIFPILPKHLPIIQKLLMVHLRGWQCQEVNLSLRPSLVVLEVRFTLYGKIVLLIKMILDPTSIRFNSQLMLDLFQQSLLKKRSEDLEHFLPSIMERNSSVLVEMFSDQNTFNEQSS